jgi:RNA polymerase sigma-70 factor (ECF subfamily)
MDVKIDRHRFEELAAQHRHELTVHCYHLLGSLQEAEDLVQETMLRAWRHLHTFRGQGSFKAWMYKIATNACLDALKKRKDREPPTVPLPDAGPLRSEPSLALERVWLEPIQAPGLTRR